MSSDLEVHFGDEFQSIENKLIYVVTDVGSRNSPYIFASVVDKNSSGEEILAIPGSHTPADIAGFSDRWGLERIIEAYKRYWANHPAVLVDPILEAVREASMRQSRIIKILN